MRSADAVVDDQTLKRSDKQINKWCLANLAPRSQCTVLSFDEFNGMISKPLVIYITIRQIEYPIV